MTDNKYRILSLDEAAKTLLIAPKMSVHASWLQPHYDVIISAIKNAKSPITLNGRAYEIYHTKDRDLFRIKVRDDFIPMAYFRLSAIKRHYEQLQNGN